MDLGPCPKIHSEKLKSEYEEAKKQKEVDYELEFERSLGNFVSDCDRKISGAQKRLDKTPEDNAKITQLVFLLLLFIYLLHIYFLRASMFIDIYIRVDQRD